MRESIPAAAIVYPTPQGQLADALLADVAVWLRRIGCRPAGVVQVNDAAPGRRRSNMVLHDLASGTLVRISEDRGRGARGCHLDHASFISAVELTARSLDRGADFLIVNKFGKREVEGGGYRCVIERALECHIPVLVAVRLEYEPALHAYAGSLFAPLSLDAVQVRTWCLRAIGAKEWNCAALPKPVREPVYRHHLTDLGETSASHE
jgi:nucleoside-triphosphatase THEP1